MSPFLRWSLYFPCLRLTLRSFVSKRPLSCSAATAHDETISSKKSHVNEGTSRKKTSRRNLLVKTKLQEYLDHIATTQDISIIDLEREYKPSIRPDKTAPNYEEEYNKVVARLVRSFSLTQLRTIANLYEIHIPTRLKKWPTAATIVEHKWRWPSLTGIKQEKKDSEITCESFLLNAKQAFLILGKDGADLLDLSSKFGVHVSFSSNPLSLKVEGSRASLGQLSKYISDFKTGIKEKCFELPTKRHVESDSLQHISRKSGVFTEDAGEGLIRMTYKCGDEAAACFAERLTFRAASEVERSSSALVYLAQNQSKPIPGQVCFLQPTYSFYPFQPPQLKPQTSKQMSLFRARRMEGWPKIDDEIQDAADPSRIAQVMDFLGNSVDLRHALLALFSSSRDNHLVTASFGHILVSSSSSKSSITQPLSGFKELAKISDWFRIEQPKRVFLPSLPHSLVNCAPARQHMIHRIVYRLPSTTQEREESLKFELVLDSIDPESSKKMEANGGDNSLNMKHSSTKSIDPYEDVVLAPTCWAESSRRLDLMLPDRPMDIRFSVSTDHIIARQHWPPSLENYYNDLKSFLTTSGQATAQPEIPLTLSKDGVDYQLSHSSTVRQTRNPDLSVSLLSEPSMRLVIESILELDNHERSRLCQVTCDDITSDVSWTTFLKNCNTLVAPPSSTQKSPRLDFS